MAKGDQINLKPHFKKEGSTLPCEGKAGDLYVFTPLDEDAPVDPEPTGSAQLWFCTKGSEGDGRNAIWLRVHLLDALDCTRPPPKPPKYPPAPQDG